MGKLIVVENDKVEGTDKHNVTGMDTTPSPSGPLPYSGVGDFDYTGKMTTQLSDFIKIGGKPVALKTSKSMLNPGETSPAGKHSGPQGKNWNPPSPAPNPTTLTLVGVTGEGTPATAAGSKFVTAGGVALLLDGDKISTCDSTNPMNTNSTVTSEGQSFVSCSE